ncbi:phosphotransferase [Mucilaginibacter pallidiroseus]|uniref:Phosphotransferase n=1 Tax=Mucilaginibacter pallidiroseus TaxID=2599295 RepID=A0A563UK04_9SPHI|nr:phosphotransferase [Mucilaginibacter pallidiroseus]TWR31707.1 phosphotransferase [Mucilaginibacter pallidiroseus]
MASESIIPYNIIDLIAEFEIDGHIANIESIKRFGLNESFRLSNGDSNMPDYLLQRVNHLAFRNIPGMMENITRISTHIPNGSIEDANYLSFPKLVKLHDGSLYHKDHDGNYWRMFFYEDGNDLSAATDRASVASETGKVFGAFLSQFSGMDAMQLHDTVIGLHDTEYKLGYLEDAFHNNIAGRAALIQSEYDFINERGDIMCGVLYLGMAGQLPLRVVHNNACLGSLLQRNDGRGIVIANLDTVMAGYLAYDFGHAFMSITIANTDDDAEIAPDIDVKLFEAFTKSYLQRVANVIQPMEVQSLMLGVLMMPYLRAVQYLNDYLNGDISHQVNYHDQNLKRARFYINLVKNIENAQPELKLVIDKCAGEYVSSMTKPQ